MHKLTVRTTTLFATLTLLLFCVFGCGKETVSVSAPAVVSTVPANGAVNIPVNQVVTAAFNSPMNAATITSSTFTVSSPSGPVAGNVTYTASGSTAVFAPSAPLAYSTTYTATITTGAANPLGVELAANYVWSFTTAPPPPTVTAVVPAPGAINVPVGQVLGATFSETVNSSTINNTTFTLTGGGSTIAGVVSASGTGATFTPSAPLAYSTTYTATISTGVQNQTGQSLMSNYSWSFMTIAPPPPTVVSTVPLNTATGVPTNQVLTATFSEPMNCGTLSSASFLLTAPNNTPVTGAVSCTGSVATFKPGSDLASNTLYTATITTAAQSSAGVALQANYVWNFRTLPAPTAPTVISTVPMNQAVNVPINQHLSATFSVAMTPTTINNTTFTVTGPGNTPVTGVVTYVAAGSVATFTPATALIPSTVYTATITTGAQDLAGMALAQNYVWTFTTGAPVLVPPTVVSTIPVNGATNVPFNQAVTATFSTAMDPATINSSTFSLTGPGNTQVAGLVAYAAISNTLTFTPTANLAAGSTYTATITTGAKNLAGTPLAANYVWSFTTGAAVVVAPELVSTLPANLATNVPLTQTVSATFSKAMDPLTFTSSTFTLTQGGVQVPATLTYDAVNYVATLTPTVPLSASTTYIATVTNGVTDLAGNPLGTGGPANPWSFTTGVAVVPPIMLGSTIKQFGAFGGPAGITSQGLQTQINNGSIGTTGASQLITGFHDDSIVTLTGQDSCTYTETPLNVGLVGINALSPGSGTINIFTAPGSSQPTVACPDEGTATTFATATTALGEAQTAYNTLQSLPPGTVLSSTELGNRTLAPGTYTSATFYDLTAGPLTLDGQGDPNAVWIFQMGSSLQVGTPTAPESIILRNGANPANVYWQVGTAATINYGGGGTMVGTVISSAGLTISSPGVAAITTIKGRVIALHASVTMVNTVINVP